MNRPTLAELLTAALKAVAERDALAQNLAACEAGEPLDLNRWPNLAALSAEHTAAESAFKVKNDRYLKLRKEIEQNHMFRRPRSR
jgi:hypothetical protein